MRYKITITAVLISLLSSCSSRKDLVIASDVAIRSNDYKSVYFLDNKKGKFMYDRWERGYYGDSTEVKLVNQEEFYKLIKKSKNI